LKIELDTHTFPWEWMTYQLVLVETMQRPEGNSARTNSDLKIFAAGREQQNRDYGATNLYTGQPATTSNSFSQTTLCRAKLYRQGGPIEHGSPRSPSEGQRAHLRHRPAAPYPYFGQSKAAQTLRKRIAKQRNREIGEGLQTTLQLDARKC
jgi:hypothetical protein